MNNVCANWITAISTFLMMLATCAIALIALLANNAWKKELKERKTFELFKTFYTVLVEFENYLNCSLNKNVTSTESFNFTDRIYAQIQTIIEEFKIVGLYSELPFLEYFASISATKVVNWDIKKTKDSTSCNVTDFVSAYKGNINNMKEILDKEIKVAKEYCLVKLNEFYN